MKSDYALSGDYGDQLQLEGFGHVAGTRFRHNDRGTIVTIVGVERRRRRCVIHYRSGGDEREISLRDFDHLYSPL